MMNNAHQTLSQQFAKDFPVAAELIGGSQLATWLETNVPAVRLKPSPSVHLPAPWQDLHDASMNTSDDGFPDKTISEYMQDEINALRAVIQQLDSNTASLVLKTDRLQSRIALEARASGGALEALNSEHLAQQSVLLGLLQEAMDHGTFPFSATLTKRIKAVLAASSITATGTLLVQALCEARSVLSSVNTGRMHRITVPSDDQPVFWQRQEWVKWAVNEVLPQIESALAVAGFGNETSVAPVAGAKVATNE